ncbi:MAG TPA: uracil-DNA glycosylase [Gemmatimonadales bacterium]|nr:uracil-DNA glycosylase [Gemmatimonadales bacterium]
MTDDRERYLRIQAELGGPEVVLRMDSVRLPVSPSTPPDQSVSPGVRPKKDWRTDAPPIPGPGLTITSPASTDLLSGPPPFESLDEIAGVVSTCEKCTLCSTRRKTVPGEGNPQARLMCVGEGPGETEDQTGRPFVGRAGELLTAMLAAIELPREEVFIANIVKCRPPQNRKPLPDEMEACLPYLRRQIQLIKPTVLLALGSTAAEGLLSVKRSLGELRLKVHRWDGIPLIVTYHPAALLRNPNWKKPAWDDVRIARQLLGD